MKRTIKIKRRKENRVYAEVCPGTDQHEGHETGNQGGEPITKGRRNPVSTCERNPAFIVK